MKNSLLIFLLIYLSTSIYAQNDTLKVDEEPWIVEKFTGLADWGMDLITVEKENSTIFFIPNMGYEARSGLSVGVIPSWRFYLGNIKDGNEYYRPSNVDMSFEVSTTGMYEAYLSFNLYTPSDWYFKNKMLGQYIPDKLYLLGNNTNKDDYKEIDVSKFESSGRVMKIIHKKWMVGVTYDCDYYDVVDADPNNLIPDVTGEEPAWSFGFGPSFSYDTRNNVTYPEKGTFIDCSWIQYTDIIGNYKFFDFTIDARKFYKLGINDNILGFQMNFHNVSGDVPFYHLAVLGGKRLFRGISQPYKYLTNNTSYIQVVYRSDLWWRFGYELFTGIGNAFDDIDQSLDNIHYMGGAGLRFRILDSEKLNLRFDYSVANKDDHGFYFTLGESF